MSDATQNSYFYLVNPNLIKEWHPTKNGNLNPRNVTIEHDTKVWWLCENSHEWEATVKERVEGKRCLVCATEIVKEKIHKNESFSKLQKSISDEGTILGKSYQADKLESHQTYRTFEQRKYTRYEYKDTAIVENPISGNSLYAQMQNISFGGMYLETNRILNKGENITIKFNKPLPFTKKRIFSSTVRWCRRLEDDEGYTDNYGLGIKFISSPPQHRK
jgi:hypothetical protein